MADAKRCTRPVADSDGGNFCNEPPLLDHTCYDHAKVCSTDGCDKPREWDENFCAEHRSDFHRRLVERVRILIADSFKTTHETSRRLLREDACISTLEFVAKLRPSDFLTAQRMAQEALKGYEDHPSRMT